MLTKAPPPVAGLSGRQVSPLVRAYFELNQLKQLYRQGWLGRGIPPARCESVAEHSFGVAVLALFLADTYFPGLDGPHIVRMALLHDFGEIYAGDLTPADHVAPAEKHRREARSVEAVFGGLPNGDEYLALWQEYELGASGEARLVRQADRLEMALQAAVYRQEGLLDPAEFFASTAEILEQPALRDILDELQDFG